MPRYNVVAKNLDNKTIKSTIEGRDDADLNKRLRDAGLTLIRYTEIIEKSAGYKMKADEVAEFSRQLASMLSSGITAARAMDIIRDRYVKPQLKSVYDRMYKDVQSGLTLSEAMRALTPVFPELFVNMIASGEASGQLDKAAEKMAIHYDKEDRLNKKIKSAMTYPIILVCFLVVAVIGLFTFILPEFFVLFDDFDGALPLITNVVISISEFMVNNTLFLIIGILLLLVFFGWLLSLDNIRWAADKAKLRVPKIGALLQIIYTARFSRTLSSLYTSGLSMTNALDISSTIMGNKYIEKQFEEVIKDVRNGEPLSDCLSKVDGFDRKLTASVLIGEESGRLDTMLVAVADSFDYEAEMATTRMVQMIEPILIVVMAFLVGTVILSVLMPIQTLYNSIGTY